MILFIDACARDCSRTRELAEAVLANIPYADPEVERLSLYELNPKPVTEEITRSRDCALKTGDFSDPFYDPARQFARADTIIMAAPYWDLSFPAILKVYIENISVNGITFRYDENGVPHGLCRCDMLYYVTTSGGEIGQNNFGYDYIKALSLGLFGIKDSMCIRAVGLDLVSVDAEMVMDNAKARLKELLRKDR